MSVNSVEISIEEGSPDNVAEVREALLAGGRVLNEAAVTIASQVAEVAEMLSAAINEGHKVLACGNGGSAADSQHFAAELVGRYRRERAPMPAIALTVDTSILTSLGNDYGFDSIFSRQVMALGAAGDALVAISTSGNSRNVLAAIETAREIGIKTIGLTGMNASQICEAVDFCIQAPATETSLIQQAHTAILHVLCDLIEKNVMVSRQPDTHV